ncbi:DUF2326 domain-containing protein [Metasolibacillus sp. FSL K6-0083]|uniref:DUF2326 domain-containing protein n=1 Tax=Metasolibacillus sp. FSL K6-0083 TaxID=2921416 RepID=UPI00315A2083
MRLSKLEVYKTYPNKEVIRSIGFNLNGLNLVVDKTTDLKQDTGNSVGKSTLIQIIDICLNASGVSKLYKNREAQGENIIIKNLLEENKVQATLEIINGNNKYKFTRSLYSRGPRYFNDIKVKESDYESHLKEVLFNSVEPKPSFRQLISKFVRTDDIQLNNVIYYLTSTSYVVYEAIYFFLLKINSEDIVSERQVYEEKLKKLKNKKEVYDKDSNLPSLDQIEQGILFIESEIKELSEQRSKIDYFEQYKIDMDEKTEINNKIDSIKNQIDLLEFERNTVIQSLEMVKKNKADIDIKRIKEIYQDAKVFNENLNKSFEEVVIFHNKMVDNRYNFINQKLIRLNHELIDLYSLYEQILSEKKELTMDLLDHGLLEKINTINLEIETLSIKKGELLKAKEIQESLKKEIDEVLDFLEKINADVEEDEHLQPINQFNGFFKEYSKKLYGEKYLLYYDSDWREKKDGRPFSIGNLVGSLGTGKQRGLIIAFDLAYLEYIKQIKCTSPDFLIYDQLENTHINQLDTIIDLATKTNSQIIFPILKERISDIDDKVIKEATILELSRNDKFFRV